ncbi:UNVERIFIED_CONTAM: Cellulose synthase-like protein E1 [Sesamum radiatum]|uniref:Cellulose synthase-like protein E1 n=1 Tax=Sesamum radiatum TaxID=300843 RepID=A0AAW2S7F7_SESRA
MDGPSLPLNARRVLTKSLILNRLYMFVNGIAVLALFYYRATTLLRVIKTRDTPVVPYLIVILSEIFLTFLWVLYQASRWRPVKLEAYPERLPEDEKLQPVDVFICTADPSKEPSLGVMNTVISAMALDYPPDKLAVYLQDDGGSYVTLNAIREAWKFARFWVPFRRKYKLKIACPAAYFSSKESAHQKFIGSSEFSAEKKIVEKKYAEFQEALEKNSVNASASVSRDHSPVIEVMTDEIGDSNLKEMPLLVYVAREKRPGHPHHFKGGALNALKSNIGLDGLRGPSIYGCNFVMTREAIYGTGKIEMGGLQIFFCRGGCYYKSYFALQGLDFCTRWVFGLMQIALSRFNPLIYAPFRLSILEIMWYAAGCLESLYVLPVYGLAIIPPVCLLYGIPLYPKVSDPYFIVFAFIFLSARLKHVQETIAFGDPLRSTVYELRAWMMKSVACYFYAVLNGILDRLGLHEANFSLTSKVVDDEQETRFKQGIYDFQVSHMLLIPICSLYILNLAAFIIGIARLFQKSDELLAQAVLSLFVVIVNYHLLEGMFLRKDKGRIALSVTLLSIATSVIILGCGSLLLFY